jgi:prophage antirepressor-like protein
MLETQNSETNGLMTIQEYLWEGAPVRVVMIDGEPHAVGKDVCDRLGYADATNAMKQHCRGVAKHHPIPDALGRMQNTRVLSEPDLLRLIIGSKLPEAEKSALNIADPHGRQQQTTIISESGLYGLILTSRKRQAKQFKKWVTGEVLPSIRKTGSYGQMSVDALVNDPATMRQLIQGYAQKNVALLGDNAALASDNSASAVRPVARRRLPSFGHCAEGPAISPSPLGRPEAADPQRSPRYALQPPLSRRPVLWYPAFIEAPVKPRRLSLCLGY